MTTSTEAMSTSKNTQAAGARRRVFSGMQPSGDKHLGNYVGA
ncbi:MAG: tryptophan--tRNA ligase, partial [bacterium]|nr:tryptophan--tRNA ligase [Candidatus Kapabacteria bacterium]